MLNILKVFLREWLSINVLKIYRYIFNVIYVKVLVYRYIFILVFVYVFENLCILIMIFREWILLINYYYYIYRG